KPMPILSLKNFDILETGTIRIKNVPESNCAKAVAPEKPKGKVDSTSLPKIDTKWFVARKSKKYGPYSKKQLIGLYKTKKISKNEILIGNESAEETLMKILFAPKPKEKVDDSSAMKVLKFSIAMALSDGNLDNEELAQLNQYCEENDLSKNLLNESIQFLNKEGPPPVGLIDDSFTKDDFLTFVEMAKADGEISSSELRLLQKVLRDLRKKYPEMKQVKLKEYLS
ncbi:MAG: hypothetical protein KC493_07870, partial [Bacteriovoracaceae bacterium]|nr:hypothetical protein [Bacteriovoracaceae bacterium]